MFSVLIYTEEWPAVSTDPMVRNFCFTKAPAGVIHTLIHFHVMFDSVLHVASAPNMPYYLDLTSLFRTQSVFTVQQLCHTVIILFVTGGVMLGVK